MALLVLALQGLVFLIWTVQAFVILFHLRRRGADRTGHMFPGPLTFIRVTRDWLGDPDHRAERLRFFVLTAALIALTALFAATRGDVATD